MRWIGGIAGALVLMASGARAADAPAWQLALDGRCPHCTARVQTGFEVPGPLPRHAITSMFIGEFARAITWCVVDLDGGDLHCHVSPGDSRVAGVPAVPESDSTTAITPTLLDEIRAEAARLWRRPLPHPRRHVRHGIIVAPPPPRYQAMPGCVEDRAIVVGGRQLNYGEMGIADEIAAGAHLRELVLAAWTDATR